MKLKEEAIHTNHKIYIGSTTKQYLSQRLAKHKSDYKRYLQKKRNYTTSYDLLKLGETTIILLEKCPCDSKDELRAREQYYLDLYNTTCVNKQAAFATMQHKKNKK